MERRSEERHPVRSEALLKRIRPEGGEEKVEICDFSGAGARVTTSAPLPVGSLVELHVSGDVFLGESVYCNGQDDSYTSGLRFEHALRNLAGIQHLMRRLLASDQREGVKR
jgi:hypothetical protein